MVRIVSTCCYAVFLLVFTSFATPKISVDKEVYDCGNVVDGRIDEAHATFTIKNTGDMSLHVTNVRPGCGCTVVKFDSLVLPGKTSLIKASVNVTNFQPGKQVKSITVTSDAQNNQQLKLEIHITIVKVIETSEISVSFRKDRPGEIHPITLACEKKDLKITGVTFTEENSGGNSGSDWMKQIPIDIKFTFTPTDSIQPNGFKVYKLALVTPAIATEMYGKLFIKTNHPDKPELQLSGNIVDLH
jgi:hypothetical protein